MEGGALGAHTLLAWLRPLSNGYSPCELMWEALGYSQNWLGGIHAGMLESM